MNENQEREAFEAWCDKTFVVKDLTRFGNGYQDSKFGYAWEAWKARAALEAEAKPAPAEPVFGYMNAGHLHEMREGRLPYGYVYPKAGAGASVPIYAKAAPAAPAHVPEADFGNIGDLLPGTYYMDPPDGGSVTVREQFERMAKDAERYRWLRDQRVGDWAICIYEDDDWAWDTRAAAVVDAAIDAAIAASKEQNKSAGGA